MCTLYIGCTGNYTSLQAAQVKGKEKQLTKVGNTFCKNRPRVGRDDKVLVFAMRQHTTHIIRVFVNKKNKKNQHKYWQ